MTQTSDSLPKSTTTNDVDAIATAVKTRLADTVQTAIRETLATASEEAVAAGIRREKRRLSTWMVLVTFGVEALGFVGIAWAAVRFRPDPFSTQLAAFAIALVLGWTAVSVTALQALARRDDRWQ